MLAQGWFEVVDEARIVAAGPDAVRFVQNLCTNDVARLADGAACEACFCNAKGGIVEHGWVRKEGDALWISVAGPRGAAFLKHLDRYLIREKAVLADRTAEHCAFHAVGEAAERVRGAAGALGAVVWARPRSPWPGVDVQAPADRRAAVRAILGAGEWTPAEAEAARIAAGLPRAGIDFPDGALPQELDRNAAAISFVKGCYLGQETVARLDAYGHVNKILRGVVLDGPAEAGAALRQGDKEIGRLGSVAVLPDGRRAALAVVRTAAAMPGVRLEADSPAGPVGATVAALPLA